MEIGDQVRIKEGIGHRDYAKGMGTGIVVRVKGKYITVRWSALAGIGYSRIHRTHAAHTLEFAAKP